MNGGFFEQKRASPTSFIAVVALHVVVLGAVVMIKGPAFVTPSGPIDLIDIRPDPEPKDEPPPPPNDRTVQPPLPTPLPPVVDIPTPIPPTPLPPLDPPRDPVIVDVVPPLPPTPPARDPVRRDAEVDPRYASALQPPYPTGEQRMGREGTVRMRVTIGVDGRVRAVERISATSDDFWRAAERQALTRWRFRPATVDGRPVESTKVMSLRFVLEGQA